MKYLTLHDVRIRRTPLKENSVAAEFLFDATPDPDSDVEPKVEVDAKLALSVAFDKSTPSKALRYQRVVPLLWMIGNFIDGVIVPELAPLLAAPAPRP